MDFDRAVLRLDVCGEYHYLHSPARNRRHGDVSTILRMVHDSLVDVALSNDVRILSARYMHALKTLGYSILFFLETDCKSIHARLIGLMSGLARMTC